MVPLSLRKANDGGLTVTTAGQIIYGETSVL